MSDNDIMYKVVDLITKDLSDQELNAQYLAIILGNDPKKIVGYGKCQVLFTEGGGTKMHSETERVFTLVWEKRFGYKAKGS